MATKAERNADGGRSALGGFLFQMVGAWSMLAWAETVDETTDDSNELSALIKLVKEGGRIRHDPYDADVVIDLPLLGLDPTDECVLVQFKYSRQHPPKSIGPQEIMEISAAFKRGIKQAKASGQTVPRCVVLTNRHCPSIEDEAHISNAPQVAPEPVATPLERHGVKMTFVTRLPEELLYDKLIDIAHRYGCDQDEIESGIDQLVGRLSDPKKYDPHTPLSPDFLIETFTGFAQPRALTSRSVSESDTEQRRMRMQRQQTLQLQGTPIARTALDAIGQRVLISALIVLTGHGGVGKSTLLWEWVERQRQQMAEGHAPLACLRRGDEVTSNFVPHIVTLWANDTSMHGQGRRGNDSPEKSLKRLQLANSGAEHPIFVLALDGLDEDMSPAYSEGIRSVVAWFSEEEEACRAEGKSPRATLIVACRDMKEFLGRWYCREVPSLTRNFEDEFLPMTLKKFSWEELYGGAREIDQELAKLIETRMHLELDTVGSYAQSGFSSQRSIDISPRWPGPSDIPIPLSPRMEDFVPEVDTLSLLRDPVLWGAYISVPEADRSLILRGSSDGLTILARWLVHRFCHKARMRGITLFPETIADILGAVVKVCPSVQQSYTLGQWRSVAVDARPLDLQLLQEAVSAGLITRESAGTWRWVPELSFVYAYLSAVGGTELFLMNTASGQGGRE